MIDAGPPCQGFSIAGCYKSDHAQNERVHDYLELIDKLRPSNVVIENVQGLMWMEKGRLIEDINKVLQSFGYKVKYDVLKAELFGVPQLRRRVIILASLTQEPVFPKPSFSDGSLDTVCSVLEDLLFQDGSLRTNSSSVDNNPLHHD